LQQDLPLSGFLFLKNSIAFVDKTYHQFVRKTIALKISVIGIEKTGNGDKFPEKLRNHFG
jgi:hypothetical protein